jgi:AcrR family transcriptional regulator
MDKETEKTTKKIITQDEILQVALKLFAQKGYFNTSLTDIKDAVGLKTPSGIYQHFKNKQAIADALYASILDSLSISIDDIRRRNRKSSEQLREIVDLLFRLTDELPEVTQFLITLNVSEFLSEYKPLLNTPPFIKIKKIFQIGIREGEIRALDPLLAYNYFFGIITHTLQMVLNGDLEKSANDYQSQVWLIAWNAVVKKQ